jgi:hypothetical protein
VTLRRLLAAAAILLVPALLAAEPAQALQAHQYLAQGHGRYTTSSGRPVGTGYHHGYRRYHRHHRYHRHYR